MQCTVRRAGAIGGNIASFKGGRCREDGAGRATVQCLALARAKEVRGRKWAGVGGRCADRTWGARYEGKGAGGDYGSRTDILVPW